jgi:flagellar biosynthesis/type III secretory pathway protein FliH
LDAAVEQMGRMEAFINELQAERDTFFEKLQSAESQVVALGELLGRKVVMQCFDIQKSTALCCALSLFPNLS